MKKWLSRKLLLTVGGIIGTGAVAATVPEVGMLTWIELVLKWVIPAALLAFAGPDALKAWQKYKQP